MQLLEERAKMVQPNISLNIYCGDSKDNFLLKLALETKAYYLLTGDKDLLVLNPYETTQILSFNDFQTAIQT